ncbi:MAG: aldo/keto reductase [Clostridia bacterium]|nr:aldo/keto reductase [Clostridia bacterium]
MVAAALGLSGCRLTNENPPSYLDEKQSQKTPVQETKKPEKEEGLIPRRKLGRTEFNISVLGLGGAFTVAHADQKDKASAIINRALDLGVNYIDTAPTYGNSEDNIGEVMQFRRKEAYLASKTLDRSRDGTMKLFEQSLKRLKTDYLDIYQLHGVHSHEDLNKIFKPRGAIKALEELKAGGAVKSIGITSHKNSSVIKKALEEYDFDCILVALNAGDVHDDSFQDVLNVALKKDIGVIAMKVAAYGRIFRKEGISTMEQALGYVLSCPVDTAIVGISSIKELEENVRIAHGFKPFSKTQMDKLETLAGEYYKDINFFKHQW